MSSSHQKLDAPSSKPGRKQPISSPVQSSKSGHPYLPLHRLNAEPEPTTPVSHQLRWDRDNPKAKWAHRSLASALRAGLIERGPCEICGAVHGEGGAIIHGHHDDYDKPMAVRWLCPLHHRQHHAAERRAAQGEGTGE